MKMKESRDFFFIFFFTTPPRSCATKDREEQTARSFLATARESSTCTCTFEHMQSKTRSAIDEWNLVLAQRAAQGRVDGQEELFVPLTPCGQRTRLVSEGGSMLNNSPNSI